MASRFALMDTDNLSMVGSYPTRAAALRIVAEAARRYGETSEEARSLVLFRQDGPADQAHIARGAELVALALAAPQRSSSPNGTHMSQSEAAGGGTRDDAPWEGGHGPVNGRNGRNGRTGGRDAIPPSPAVASTSH
jgi:hypothetical protein